MFNLEVWCSGTVKGKLRAIKVVVLLDYEPGEADIRKAHADAEATWRRWFVIGKGVEKVVGKDPIPVALRPAKTGHKVVAQ